MIQKPEDPINKERERQIEIEYIYFQFNLDRFLLSKASQQILEDRVKTLNNMAQVSDTEFPALGLGPKLNPVQPSHLFTISPAGRVQLVVWVSAD